MWLGKVVLSFSLSAGHSMLIVSYCRLATGSSTSKQWLTTRSHFRLLLTSFYFYCSTLNHSFLIKKRSKTKNHVVQSYSLLILVILVRLRYQVISVTVACYQKLNISNFISRWRILASWQRQRWISWSHQADRQLTQFVANNLHSGDPLLRSWNAKSYLFPEVIHPSLTLLFLPLIIF